MDFDSVRPGGTIKIDRVIVVLLGLLVVGIKAVALKAFVAAPVQELDVASVAAAGEAVLLRDDFAGPDGLITGHDFYDPGQFPANGTSLPSNPSSLWEGDNGYFYRQGNWGYSGRPTDWKDRYFFRMNTRRFDVGNAAISWRYRSAAFGEGGWPPEGADAVDVWVRYQTQYNLYAFQFDRTDDGFQAKRKIPAEGWRGPPKLVANKGVYYTLPTDSAQPVVGAGKFRVSWRDVENRLPASERAKPGFPNLAHDSTTPYDFKVTVKDLQDGKVQIQAYRSGVLIYSTTDDGRSGVAANGETQGAHLDWGYFDTVPGWQAEWGRAITHAGALGFRADDIQFWIADLVVRDLGN